MSWRHHASSWMVPPSYCENAVWGVGGHVYCIFCPLIPVPLSLCHMNSTLTKNPNKSVLMKKTEIKHKDRSGISPDVYLVDLMFCSRTLLSVPQTFGGIANMIFSMACNLAPLENVVCDYYAQGQSIKDPERTTRDENGSKYSIIFPSQSRPSDFNKVLLSSNLLQRHTIYIATENHCRIFRSESGKTLHFQEHALSCVHEQADTSGPFY